MKLIKKQKSHAFGKDVYLLGRDETGKCLWLEAARWDCGWYWGFGYIETYEHNRRPELARDIRSHTHWDGRIKGQQEKYSIEKQCFVKSEYYHTFNDHKDFQATVLNETENWKLAELMDSAYTLKAAAEFFGRGGSRVTENPKKDLLKNTRWTKRINTVLLPAVFEEMYKILTPAPEVE